MKITYAPFILLILAGCTNNSQTGLPYTEAEKRAQGMALMTFFNQMAQPGGQPGFSGNLAKINSSIPPAIAVYEAELAKNSYMYAR